MEKFGKIIILTTVYITCFKHFSLAPIRISKSTWKNVADYFFFL